MSTGISIKSATYGTASKTVDATSGVTNHDNDGTINFSVSASSLNVEDPAPGQVKTLNVSYTINNGKVNTLSVKDGNTLHIEAPPQRTADGLQITKAQYGYTGNYTDVTNAVQDSVSNGSIDLTVGFKQVGIPDPNPNKQKSLIVEYTINGAKGSQTVNDGAKFTLSAPPVSSTSSPSASGSAIMNSVMNAIWLFIKVSFLVSMILVSWNVGNRIGNQAVGFVLAILAFVTYGLFPILFLPTVIFFWRLFSDHTVFTTGTA